MVAKLIEIRDSGTFIPAIAIRCDPANAHEAYLLSRAGYGNTREKNNDYILLAKIDGGELSQLNYDPYAWNNGTMRSAHLWLTVDCNFEDLLDGQTLDVQFLNGITKQRKLSEMHEALPML